MHFSDAHNNYWVAFKCITKSDPNILLSSSHPNMQEMSSPKTKVCVQAIRQKRKSRPTDTSGDKVSTTTKPPKIARLSNLEVSEFITRNKISNEYEHCVKCVQIRSFLWSVFSRIRTEYEEILRISPYSVPMWENTDQEKLRIWTHFTQWNSLLLHIHKKKRTKKTWSTFFCRVRKSNWVTCLPPQNG